MVVKCSECAVCESYILKNQTVLVTFSITIVLAFVGKGVKRGGRWHFELAVKGAVAKKV